RLVIVLGIFISLIVFSGMALAAEFSADLVIDNPKEATDPEIEEKIKDIAEKKSLGKEKVSGYVCEKYQYLYHDKSSGVLTQWLSKRLGYPIKTEYKAPAYHMLTEYKNIKKERIPDSLFEIPSGFQKMQLPMMPGMSQQQ
ncbi:MAG: DUF4412 domain-containing protein, partial [Desulfobacterales bacterium]